MSRPELAQIHSRRLFDEAWAGLSAQTLRDPGNERRLAAIAALCPTVDTLLDVGCGSGDVLRALAGKARRRYGCDTSIVGLSSLGEGPGAAGAAVLAAADRLPFPDRAFELVTCCDVLEHLPEPVALRAVCELMRVAGRYVLLNVPLDEDLGWSELRCGACGHRYHRDHHQRSYRAAQVEEMLPAAAFRLLRSETTGWTVRHPLRLPAGLGAALGLGYDPGARCERCGHKPAPPSRPRRLARDAFVFCHNALTRPLRSRLSRDSEIVALFERKDGP